VLVMPGLRWWAMVLTLACAFAAGGCGASSSPSTGATSTGTAGTDTSHSAIAGHALAELTQPLPHSTARIPAPSSNRRVESAYLTALFDDAQNEWRRDLQEEHISYTPARLVIYWGTVESRCGKTEESGPFYCSGDRTVYLDLRFFALLYHTAGVQKVAQAFIVGHEVAHHVQGLLGIAQRVSAANEADPGDKNARSVRVELEADCLAGVWGRAAYGRGSATSADLGDAVRTAELIGDDYGAEASGQVVDDSLWEHGSSQQRQYWLRTGFQTGRPASCDTFAHP
jgi:uncharacterized protein